MLEGYMETANLVLEYIKVMTSPQIIAGIVIVVFLVLFREAIRALLNRIAKIKFPGGAEVETSQSERQKSEEKIDQKQLQLPQSYQVGLPSDLTPTQRTNIEEILKAEKATSYLWEYRYLNYFLVYSTQSVLDWLIGLNQSTTYRHFDGTWTPHIPSANERAAIINALQTHHLIQVSGDVIQVTEKGREYQQWRGILPQPTQNR